MIPQARPELAPQLGTSIVLFPNSCRILDQLGLYDELRGVSDVSTLGEAVWVDRKRILDSNTSAWMDVRCVPFLILEFGD